MKNFSYTIKEGEHKGETLWSGRYCAVLAMTVVQQVIKDKLKHFLLVSKRGKGTPNYQGCWNIQCGFLECDETGAMCASRETFEECGVTVDPSEYRLFSVLTDPSVDKNVTLRYGAILNDFPEHNQDYKGSGGEEDEVENVKWLDLDDEEFINKSKWAFNHKEIIGELKKQIEIINKNKN